MCPKSMGPARLMRLGNEGEVLKASSLHAQGHSNVRSTLVSMHGHHGHTRVELFIPCGTCRQDMLEDTNHEHAP